MPDASSSAALREMTRNEDGCDASIEFVFWMNSQSLEIYSAAAGNVTWISSVISSVDAPLVRTLKPSRAAKRRGTWHWTRLRRETVDFWWRAEFLPLREFTHSRLILSERPSVEIVGRWR